MSTVDFALTILPQLTSVISAYISTQYAIDRGRSSYTEFTALKRCLRESNQHIEMFYSIGEKLQHARSAVARDVPAFMSKLDKTTRRIGETCVELGARNDGFRSPEDPWNPCEGITSLCFNVFGQCGQTGGSTMMLGETALRIDAGGRSTEDLNETCAKLMSCWKPDSINTDPMFWEQQKWLEFGGQRLGSLHLQLHDTIRHPSSTTLIISWLVLTLAAVAYYESHQTHRFRRVFLGSAIVAISIGGFEKLTMGLSMETIILTNIPWCLAWSITLDALAHIFMTIFSRNSVEEGPSSRRRIQWNEKEKA